MMMCKGHVFNFKGHLCIGHIRSLDSAVNCRIFLSLWTVGEQFVLEDGLLGQSMPQLCLPSAPLPSLML